MFLQKYKVIFRTMLNQHMSKSFTVAQPQTSSPYVPIDTLDKTKIFDRQQQFADPMDLYVKAGKRYYVGSWLLLAAGGVYFMVLLGGYTRLTSSGLSMVKWKPIEYKYPQSEDQWQTEFDHYKEFPEYKHSNVSMERFKSIYRLEYAHRLSGSTLGAVYVLPLIGFRLLGWVTPKFGKRLYAIGCIGLSQGLIGWWMVKSGLNQPKPIYQSRPRVSTYRLCVHLSMATSIYSLLLWNALNVLRGPQSNIFTVENMNQIKGLRRLGTLLLACVAFNIFSGATMAGIDAGKVYNTWPSINGQYIPEGMYKLRPFYKNFFENVACVQFNHRNAAYLTYFVTALVAYKAYGIKAPLQLRMAALLVIGLVNYQLYSGITTLLACAPIHSCSIHQFNALNVLTATLILLNFTRKPSSVYLKHLKQLQLK